jgi:hypothetical protein
MPNSGVNWSRPLSQQLVSAMPMLVNFARQRDVGKADYTATTRHDWQKGGLPWQKGGERGDSLICAIFPRLQNSDLEFIFLPTGNLFF